MNNPIKQITKLCVKHLRIFSKNQGFDIKSTDAHELVAAFFGYKSRAIMLSDTISPIENLTKAQYLILTPSHFIEARRKCLKRLPANLLNNSTLGEELFTFLITNNHFSGQSFATWKHYVDIIATEYLLKHGSSILPINFSLQQIAYSRFDKPINEYVPILNDNGKSVTLTTNLHYALDDIGFKFIEITLTIKVQRIAGHVGYANSEISIINYSIQSTNQGVSR